jgi:hypothetical protein
MILGNPRPKPTNLAEWLEQAIGGLVPSAQARIRAEIEAHYAEAVQSHLAGGSVESAAQAAALIDLGDAKAAARRFGREHLTKNDAAILAGLIKKSTRDHVTAAIGLVILISSMSAVAPLILPPGHKPFESFRAILGFCVLYALDVPGTYIGRPGRGVVAAIDPPSTSLIQLLRIHFIINLILGVFCLVLDWSISRTDSDALFSWPFYFAVFYASGHALIRLRQKLQLLAKDSPGYFPRPPLLD